MIKISIIIAIIIFGIIIFIHEAGHFFTAKLFGMQVNEFSVGMGPRICGFQRGETKYSLRCIPMGGYCALEGEDGTEEENPRAFAAKPKWQRAIVLVAGGAMNIILGFIVMFGIVVSGKYFDTLQIAKFADDAVSNTSVDGGSALRENDKIIKVNGTKCNVNSDLTVELILDEDGKLDFTVLRDGETVELKNVTFNKVELEDGKSSINIDFSLYGSDNALSHMFTVAQHENGTWDHIGNLFVSLKNAFVDTFFEIVSLIKLVWISLIELLTGGFGLNDLSGPVGTTTAIGEAASYGMSSLMNVAVFITINLGVMNLMPFPALDGGRVVLLGVEAIRRKPLNPKIEMGINAAGMAALILLMLVVTFNDIIKLF